MSGLNKPFIFKPLPNKPLPKTTNSRDDKIPSLLKSSPKSNNLRDIKIILEYNEDYIKLMNKINRRRQHILKSKVSKSGVSTERLPSKKASSTSSSSKKASSTSSSSKKASSTRLSSKKASTTKVPIKNNTFLKRMKMFLTK